MCGENLVGRHDPSCPEEIQNQLVHPVVGIGSQVPIGNNCLFVMLGACGPYNSYSGHLFDIC